MHRASGVFLFLGSAVLLWVLDASLASEASFKELAATLQTPLLKFVMWSILAGLIYHTVAGVRHLLMDMGIGESLEGGRMGSKITLVVAAVLIVLGGMWIW